MALVHLVEGNPSIFNQKDIYAWGAMVSYLCVVCWWVSCGTFCSLGTLQRRWQADFWRGLSKHICIFQDIPCGAESEEVFSPGPSISQKFGLNMGAIPSVFWAGEFPPLVSGHLESP